MVGISTCSCLLLIGLQLVSARYIDRQPGGRGRRVSVYRESRSRFEPDPLPARSRGHFSNHVDMRDHLHVDRLDSRPPPLHIRGPVPRRETNHVREMRRGGDGLRSQMPRERGMEILAMERVRPNNEMITHRILRQQQEQERKIQDLLNTQREQLLLDMKLDALQQQSQTLSKDLVQQTTTKTSPTGMVANAPAPKSEVIVHTPQVVSAPTKAAAAAQQATSDMITKSLMATFKAMGFTPEGLPGAAAPAAAPVVAQAAVPQVQMQTMPAMGGMAAPGMPGMSPMGPMAGMGPMPRMPMGMMSEIVDFDRPDHMGMGMNMGYSMMG